MIDNLYAIWNVACTIGQVITIVVFVLAVIGDIYPSVRKKTEKFAEANPNIIIVLSVLMLMGGVKAMLSV